MAKTDFYSARVLQQRVRREKVHYEQIVDDESKSDINSSSDSVDMLDFQLLNNTTTTTRLHRQELDDNVDGGHFSDEDNFENYYSSNEADNVNIDDEILLLHDGNLPLYQQASVSVGKAVQYIMNYYINSNYDKSKVVALLNVIKYILPIPNRLPTTFHQILKIYGKKPSSTVKFYYNSCLALTAVKGGQQYCTNFNCPFTNIKLSKRQLMEIFTMNVRDKLQSIVRRKISVITGYEELFPKFDTSSGNRYQLITKNVANPITLNIHVDGAPLVTIKQLTDLSVNGTSIFVNEHEFQVNVKTLFFISDLPAKSLFTETIHFNGYFACTNCITESTLYKKQIIYPYRNNNYMSRNHEQFVKTAKEVELISRVDGKYAKSVVGIKGFSSLLKLFRYPDDIIYDYMHLIWLNHVPTLLKRFIGILSKNDINAIDSLLPGDGVVVLCI
ncbi:unnamed protein product [Rotaria socialis]|uniref:Uncharacterized protein n=1 Tax=Rotaria socialis TaxID=392032 RepID=A0A821BD45_9BILA|nr:unnamed protein product [Rotaria socialis]CAF3496151.1 unnamed protein product [Rotaria socialis]CAF3719512.1 unnamed protein product [Rotaria socialis]CAF3738853.1 unnamed protein product [Rotaria socialis]CAF4395267.1 unnamed protein product [Rotaria socialis]